MRRPQKSHLPLFIWHYLVSSNYKRKKGHIFVAFSEYMNFTKLSKTGWFLKVLWPSQNMWTLVVQDLKLNYCYHLGKQGLIERLLISFSVAGLIKQRSLRQTLGKLEKEKFHSLHPSNEGSWSEPIFCTHLKIKLDSLGWLFLREYFRPSRIMKECEF